MILMSFERQYLTSY